MPIPPLKKANFAFVLREGEISHGTLKMRPCAGLHGVQRLEKSLLVMRLVNSM